MRLLVYGSLKKGFFNHTRFGLDKVPFIGEDFIADYKMINLGAYPGIFQYFPEGEKSWKVKGEVYDISPESPEWRFLDQVERGAGFRLTKVRGSSKKKEDDLYAFTYQNYEGTEEEVPDGDWRG